MHTTKSIGGNQNEQRDLASVAEGAGTEILTGTSLKAHLDWDDPTSQCGTVYNIANVELS